MRARPSAILTLVGILWLAGPAAATHWVDFQPRVDCDGWHVDGEVKIAAAHPYLDIAYTVTLVADGETVEEQSGTVRVDLSAGTSLFSVGADWENPVTGEVTASGTFVLPFTSQGDSIQSFAEVMTCGQTATPHRPAWWIHHRGQWPVTELEIGGRTRGQRALIRLMRRCGPSRVSVRLLRHLVAAKLNVLSGVPDTAAETIAAADAFLAEHWLHRLPRAQRREARELLRSLRRFNRGEEAGKSLAAEPLPLSDLAVEQFHWGELKAAYR